MFIERREDLGGKLHETMSSTTWCPKTPRHVKRTKKERQEVLPIKDDEVGVQQRFGNDLSCRPVSSVKDDYYKKESCPV